MHSRSLNVGVLTEEQTADTVLHAHAAQPLGRPRQMRAVR